MASRPDIAGIGSCSAGVALLERLRKGTDNVEEHQWPGSDDPEATFLMVPLLCDELQDAYAGTWQRWEKLGLDMNVYNSDDFFAELAIQVLARSMRDPDDETRKTPLFADADQLRSNIRAGERDALSAMYQAFAADVDPDPDMMTEERFAEIEAFVKKKDGLSLSAISSRTLAAYMLGTAAPSAS